MPNWMPFRHFGGRGKLSKSKISHPVIANDGSSEDSDPNDKSDPGGKNTIAENKHLVSEII